MEGGVRERAFTMLARLPVSRRAARYSSWRTSLAPSRVNVSPRRSSRLSEKGCGVGLRFAYWVAQVCNADARDHRRVAEDGWRAGEVVEESNSRAEKNRRDVDVDLVEETGIQELLDGVSAVDPNGLPGGGSFGLLHGAFQYRRSRNAQSSYGAAIRRGSCG